MGWDGVGWDGRCMGMCMCIEREREGEGEGEGRREEVEGGEGIVSESVRFNWDEILCYVIA